MATEYFVTDSIVVDLRMKAPAMAGKNSSGEP